MSVLPVMESFVSPTNYFLHTPQCHTPMTVNPVILSTPICQINALQSSHKTSFPMQHDGFNNLTFRQKIDQPYLHQMTTYTHDNKKVNQEYPISQHKQLINTHHHVCLPTTQIQSNDMVQKTDTKSAELSYSQHENSIHQLNRFTKLLTKYNVESSSVSDIQHIQNIFSLLTLLVQIAKQPHCMQLMDALQYGVTAPSWVSPELKKDLTIAETIGKEMYKDIEMASYAIVTEHYLRQTSHTKKLEYSLPINLVPFQQQSTKEDLCTSEKQVNLTPLELLPLPGACLFKTLDTAIAGANNAVVAGFVYMYHLNSKQRYGCLHQMKHYTNPTHSEIKVYLKPIAVKVIVKQQIVLQGAVAEQRLIEEINISQSLLHRNVVRTLEVCDISNMILLIMEYANRGDLVSLIRENICISENDSREIFAQLLSGCLYLHDHHIVHRDIKPENILLQLSDDQTQWKALLGDFGAATSIQNSNQLLTETLGTVAYAAPEILQCIPYTGEAVDVWSLGVVLYTMLFGRLPWNLQNCSLKDAYQIVFETQLNLPLTSPIYGTISFESRDLLQKMIVINPLGRIPLKHIFNHPWFSVQTLQRFRNIIIPFNFNNESGKPRVPKKMIPQHQQQHRLNPYDISPCAHSGLSKTPPIPFLLQHGQPIHTIPQFRLTHQRYVHRPRLQREKNNKAYQGNPTRKDDIYCLTGSSRHTDTLSTDESVIFLSPEDQLNSCLIKNLYPSKELNKPKESQSILHTTQNVTNTNLGHNNIEDVYETNLLTKGFNQDYQGRLNKSDNPNHVSHNVNTIRLMQEHSSLLKNNNYKKSNATQQNVDIEKGVTQLIKKKLINSASSMVILSNEDNTNMQYKNKTLTNPTQPNHCIDITAPICMSSKPETFTNEINLFTAHSSSTLDNNSQNNLNIHSPKITDYINSQAEINKVTTTNVSSIIQDTPQLSNVQCTDIYSQHTIETFLHQPIDSPVGAQQRQFETCSIKDTINGIQTFVDHPIGSKTNQSLSQLSLSLLSNDDIYTNRETKLFWSNIKHPKTQSADLDHFGGISADRTRSGSSCISNEHDEKESNTHIVNKCIPQKDTQHNHESISVEYPYEILHDDHGTNNPIVIQEDKWFSNQSTHSNTCSTLFHTNETLSSLEKQPILSNKSNDLYNNATNKPTVQANECTPLNSAGPEINEHHTLSFNLSTEQRHCTTPIMIELNKKQEINDLILENNGSIVGYQMFHPVHELTQEQLDTVETIKIQDKMQNGNTTENINNHMEKEDFITIIPPDCNTNDLENECSLTTPRLQIFSALYHKMFSNPWLSSKKNNKVIVSSLESSNKLQSVEISSIKKKPRIPLLQLPHRASLISFSGTSQTNNKQYGNLLHCNKNQHPISSYSCLTERPSTSVSSPKHLSPLSLKQPPRLNIMASPHLPTGYTLNSWRRQRPAS